MLSCSRCGLISPAGIIRCDCGYDFSIGGVQALPENRGLALASLGDRFAGQCLDSLIAYGGLFLSTHIAQSLGIASGLALVPFLLYLLFADGMGTGQSFGKKLMRTAVVDEKTGAPCTYGGSLLRNVVMFVGIFDWGFIFGKRRQRLGDRAARTIVIKRQA